MESPNDDTGTTGTPDAVAQLLIAARSTAQQARTLAWCEGDRLSVTAAAHIGLAVNALSDALNHRVTRGQRPRPHEVPAA